MRTLRLTRTHALTRTLGAGVVGGVLAASGAPYLPSDATAYLTLAGSEYHVNASDLQYQTSAGEDYLTLAGNTYLTTGPV